MAESAKAKAAFERCYEQHRARVFHWASRYAGGRSAWAEDLTHDVFVKLWQKLPELEGPEEIQPWLYRVTANLALTKLRSERTVGDLLGRFFRQDAEPAVPGPEQAFDDREDGATALKALQALPEKERVVLSMKILDGATQKEISTALGLSEGYVSKLVTRGEARLRAVGWEVGDGKE